MKEKEFELEIKGWDFRFIKIIEIYLGEIMSVLFLYCYNFVFIL